MGETVEYKAIDTLCIDNEPGELAQRASQLIDIDETEKKKKSDSICVYAVALETLWCAIWMPRPNSNTCKEQTGMLFVLCLLICSSGLFPPKVSRGEDMGRFYFGVCVFFLGGVMFSKE